MRHIALNKHRVRYWLSTGAIPTPRVQRLLEKFDFCPKAISPFGTQHTYEKPVHEYGMQAFRGLGRPPMSERRVEWYYRQKLQEQMNIVERRRRLAAEVLGGAHAAVTPFEAAVDAGEETDGLKSEEADIFERKAKFDKLLKKFQDHQNEKGLLLKGNDLRSNIYLRKMQKLARQDLGLDVIGYKDYVNNLRTFAQYNSDLTVLSHDNMWKDVPEGSKKLIELDAKAFDDNSTGIERANKHSDTVSVSLAKCMRTHYQNMNKRDERALDDLAENLNSYLAVSMTLVDQVKRFYRLHRLDRNDRGSWDDLFTQLHEVTVEILEEANVSGRQFEQIKMLLKLDRDILNPMGKRHATFHTMPNLYDNFVDFTKLPKDLTKEQKSILYRPKKMKELSECYRNIAVQVKSAAYRKLERQHEQEKTRAMKLNWEPRRIKKPAHETAIADKLWEAIDKFLSTDTVSTKELSFKMDPALKVEAVGQENYGEMLLEKLLRERRKMPKDERLAKFRNDSVDEVDTTDLEYWCLKSGTMDSFQSFEEEPEDYSIESMLLEDSEDEE